MDSILNQLKDRKMFAKGKRGVVYTAFLENKKSLKKVAIKEKKIESTAEGNIEREAEWLKILNNHNIGPKFIAFENNSLIYEFVEGEFIQDFLLHSSRKDTLQIFNDVMEQCRKMDKLGINKLEMTRPRKHVIITSEKSKENLKQKQKLVSVMIDFERCRRTDKPKNVTQFCQFITLAENSRILEQKNIFIDKNEMINTARNYKENPDSKNFLKIKSFLK